MEPKTFAELGLSSKVQAAISAAGYTTPTPIQAAAIPIAVTGRDVLGIAQTGTGKTASFVLPMITRLETGRARARMPRSLIPAPTRELAAQVAQSFEKYGINNKLSLALLIGGVSMDDQVKKLETLKTKFAGQTLPDTGKAAYQARKEQGKEAMAVLTKEQQEKVHSMRAEHHAAWKAQHHGHQGTAAADTAKS